MVPKCSKWFQMVPKALSFLNESKWFLKSIMTRVCVLVWQSMILSIFFEMRISWKLRIFLRDMDYGLGNKEKWGNIMSTWSTSLQHNPLVQPQSKALQDSPAVQSPVQPCCTALKYSLAIQPCNTVLYYRLAIQPCNTVSGTVQPYNTDLQYIPVVKCCSTAFQYSPRVQPCKKSLQYRSAAQPCYSAL